MCVDCISSASGVIIFIKWVYIYSIADVVHMMCTFNDSRYVNVTKPNHPSKYCYDKLSH